MAVQRTLILLKPDAVHRGLTGEILARFERKGLRLLALDLRIADEPTARAHYAEHDGQHYFPPLLAFITSGPLIAAVLEGSEAIAVVRNLIGSTDGRVSAPGTIRGDFGLSKQLNLVHASDGIESAAREIALWFPGGIRTWRPEGLAWIESEPATP